MGLITVKFPSKAAGYTAQWVAPFGATQATVICKGASGGGGSANAAGGRGGGGAGGAISISVVSITPAVAYTATVPGQPNGSTQGGDAKFSQGVTDLVIGKGGAPGGNAVTGSLSGAGGLGSVVGSLGDQAFAGGNGSPGVASSRSGAGGGGAGTSGPGGNASGTTAGQGTDLYGGDGAPGSTASTAGNGVSAQVEEGGGAGARATSSTLQNGGKGGAGLVVIIFEVPDNPGGLEPGEIACDAFTGGDVPNIEGRSFDGCGSPPGGESWDEDDVYNLAGTHLKISGGKLVCDTVGETQAVVVDPPPCPTGILASRTVVNFPKHGTPSVPEQCNLVWEDDFAGASGPLEGRSHNGGSLGTLTYQRIDGNYDGASSGALLGDGFAYNPDGLFRAMYRLSGASLPASFDLVIDVERTSSGGGNLGNVCGFVRSHDPWPVVGEQHGLKNYGLSYNTTQDPADDLHGFWNGWVNGSFGGLVTGSSVDPPGDQGIDTGEVRSIRYRVRSTHPQVSSFIHPDSGAQPCDADWRISATVEDCQFGAACLGTAAGPCGVGWNPIGAAGTDHPEDSYRIRAVRIYEYVPPVVSIPTHTGYVYNWLAFSKPDTTGFFLSLQRDFTDTWHLYTSLYWQGTTGTGYLRRNAPVGNAIPVDTADPYTLDAILAQDQLTLHWVLYARVNGVVVQQFDLEVDLPDDFDAPIPIGELYTTGDYVLGIFDGYFGTVGLRMVEVSRYSILCPGFTECTPCSQGAAAFAMDKLTGGDDSDIDGRQFDGGGYEILDGFGIWEKQTGDQLAIQGLLGYHVSAGAPARTVYRVINSGVHPVAQGMSLPFTVDHLTATPSEAMVYVHQQAGFEDGFRLRAIFDSSSTIYRAESVSGGIVTILHTWDPATDTRVHDIADGESHVLTLCADCDGDMIRLRPSIDGLVLDELEDDTWPDGYPAIGILDQDAAAGGSLSFPSATVVGCATVAPGAPPPGGGGETGGGQILGSAVMENQVWQPLAEDSFVAQVNLAPRLVDGATSPPLVMVNQQLRPIIFGVDEGGGEFNGDPGEAIPVGACSTLPPPPTVPVDPYDGPRLFFAYNAPTEGNIAPFDTTVWAMGPWIVDHLAIAAARNLHILTSIGNYTKFQDASGYREDFMFAWIASHAPYMGIVEAYATASPPVYIGQFVIDDWRATIRWGARRPTAHQVDRIAEYWVALYGPWIRTLLRDTPTQAHNDDPSEPWTHLRGFYAQYVCRYGSFTPWMNAQVSTCISLGDKELLLGWNFLNSCGQNTPLPPAQILDQGFQMADNPYPKILGIGGWRWDEVYLNRAGVLDAFSQVHNRQALNHP